MVGSVNDFFNTKVTNLCKEDGNCSQCGACCGAFLPVSDAEVKKIKNYVKAHHIKPQKHGTAVLANPAVDFNCPFLDTTKKCEKCTIYEVRPMICRLFKCSEGPDVCESMAGGGYKPVYMWDIF